MKKAINRQKKTVWFETTVGEFVEAVYEAAMEEYMDEVLARRIAMQMLLRKLRQQHKLKEAIKSGAATQKKAVLKKDIKYKGKKKA